MVKNYGYEKVTFDDLDDITYVEEVARLLKPTRENKLYVVNYSLVWMPFKFISIIHVLLQM